MTATPSDDLMAAPDEISPQPVTGRQESLSLRVRFQLLALLSIFPAMIFPIWWAGLARERHYSDAGLALMQTMQMGGIFLASLALLVLEGRVHRGKLSALSLAMMGIVFLAVSFLPSLHEVLCAYLFMGIGMSAALSLSSIYIGQSSGPERQFAVQTGVGTLAGAINMAVFPYIQARFGAAGVQLSCALPLLVGALAVSTLPAGRAPKEARKPGMLGLAQGSARQPTSWIASIPAIAATVAFSSFAYNLFNFSERTASARGIGLEGMGALLCVAMVCGLSGPAAGFLLGN
ncbi:MAG: hypothetical protein JO042_14725, partial [Sinobacteraceae bacterium]|nr:hypothetical protein [Nevskiaceae bacterium]